MLETHLSLQANTTGLRATPTQTHTNAERETRTPMQAYTRAHSRILSASEHTATMQAKRSTTPTTSVTMAPQGKGRRLGLAGVATQMTTNTTKDCVPEPFLKTLEGLQLEIAGFPLGPAESHSCQTAVRRDNRCSKGCIAQAVERNTAIGARFGNTSRQRSKKAQ